MLGAGRRIRRRQQPDCLTRDSIQSSQLREMARFGDDWVSIFRYPSVGLLLSPAEGAESFNDGHISMIV